MYASLPAAGSGCSGSVWVGSYRRTPRFVSVRVAPDASVAVALIATGEPLAGVKLAWYACAPNAVLESP